MQRLGFRLPVVEGSRKANRFGRWMSELKANGHELEAGVLGVVVVVVMFHGWRFIGTVDLYLLKNVPFHFAIMRPKSCRGYGVLPYQRLMNPVLAGRQGGI
jgi:hypothetical protein